MEAASAAGFAISRNPVLVGGTTAFLVTAFYVSANALWYQPYFHTGAFVATRQVAQPAPAMQETRPVERSSVPVRSVPVTEIVPQPAAAEPEAVQNDTMRTDAIPAPSGDERLRSVQEALAQLGLYAGEVDGLNGPKTRAAVENYQRIAGLEPSGEVDTAMLKRLDLASVQQMPVPRPADRPAKESDAPKVQTAAVAAQPDIVRIQAGLRAFGNQGIELDGKIGTRTREALKEFQSLFGLPVTGEPDAEVMAKMREIGLTN